MTRRSSRITSLLDLLLIPLVVPAGVLLKAVRRVGLQRLPMCRRLLLSIGVLPLRRHYYEPFIRPEDLRHPLDRERELPGIHWNVPAQLELLSTLRYAGEVQTLLADNSGAFGFRLHNESFESGDAEFLYQVIRALKPRSIIEVGSGQSTRIARAAIKKNSEELAGYKCHHTCIEPYEAPWLESLGVNVLRQRVEDVDSALFGTLGRNDLLFIDSSHIIRPQGDVLTEYLQILPTLKPGVVVHVHDVFSPRDYPDDWVFGKLLLWNEQYLLEAFLTNNIEWEVMAALNLLKHRHFEALQKVCPYLSGEREPGSIYIRKI